MGKEGYIGRVTANCKGLGLRQDNNYLGTVREKIRLETRRG